MKKSGLLSILEGLKIRADAPLDQFTLPDEQRDLIKTEIILELLNYIGDGEIEGAVDDIVC